MPNLVDLLSETGIDSIELRGGGVVEDDDDYDVWSSVLVLVGCGVVAPPSCDCAKKVVSELICNTSHFYNRSSINIPIRGHVIFGAQLFLPYIGAPPIGRIYSFYIGFGVLFPHNFHNGNVSYATDSKRGTLVASLSPPKPEWDTWPGCAHKYPTRVCVLYAMYCTAKQKALRIVCGFAQPVRSTKCDQPHTHTPEL